MKKVDQLLPDGTVVLDYDSPMLTQEISELFYDLFGQNSVMDRKQHLLYGKIGVLVAAVTYLGNPWEIYKKRIQLKDYYPSYFFENDANGIQTMFVGVYRYKTTILFVVFDPLPYVSRKSHNSSAHVQTFDLQYALEAGVYSKIDANGNSIMVMDAPSFVDYVLKKANEEKAETYDDIKGAIQDYLGGFFDYIPKNEWKGIDCISEMRDAKDRNWRQIEWHGYYLEYLFKKYSADHPNSQIHYYADKRKGGIDFDLVFSEEDWIFGDLKADKEGENILGNNFSSFDEVITNHGGQVIYIVVRCKTEPDKKHGYKTTQFWNEQRDEDRKYKSREELEERCGRRMKYSVTPQRAIFLRIDKTAYAILKKDPFHQGKNSNGKERKPKLEINKSMIEALSVHSIKLAP